jgi:hypothetical protein
MYSKEPVQQVLGFLVWKMHARVAYLFNSNTTIKILLIKVSFHITQSMIYAINCILQTLFVCFGNIMFLRLIGIPMGTKSAALIADLFYTAISTH